MEKNFNLEIISPEKIILSEKVNSVTMPSFEGEMTILPDHIPLITFLRPGIVRIEGSKEGEYFVEEGTVEFSNNTFDNTQLVSPNITSSNKNLNNLIQKSDTTPNAADGASLVSGTTKTKIPLDGNL